MLARPCGFIRVSLGVGMGIKSNIKATKFIKLVQRVRRENETDRQTEFRILNIGRDMFCAVFINKLRLFKVES